MTEWATNVVTSIGAWGLFGLIVLENLFPPIPSEVILPLAGFAVEQGEMSFFMALAAATGGAVVGALVLYAVGGLVGERRLERFVSRYGRYALVGVDDLERAFGWFHRHGPGAVLVGRCVPGVRSLISLPAGLTRMPLPQFVLYTALGSAVWNALLISLGWALGSSWRRVTDSIEFYAWIVLGVVVVGLAWFVVRRLRRRRASGV